MGQRSSILIETGQLLLDQISALANLEQCVANVFGAHRVAGEGTRHHEHGASQHVVDRNAAECQVGIDRQSILVIGRIGWTADRKHREVSLVVFFFRRFDHHFLQAVATQGKDHPKRIAVALNETINPLGGLVHEAFGIAVAVNRELERACEVVRAGIPIGGRLGQALCEYLDQGIGHTRNEFANVGDWLALVQLDQLADAIRRERQSP